MINNFEKKKSSILVGIVNYKTPDLVINCLRSLANEIGYFTNPQVIVADNDSGDDSVGKIDTAIKNEDWGNWAFTLPLDVNGGESFAKNHIVNHIREKSELPKYVIFLDPDTFIRPGALKVLVEFMDSNSEVGIAGSRLEDPDGTPQHSAFRFHTIFSELANGLRLGIISNLLNKWVVAPPVRDDTFQTDWVSGAGVIIRSKVFEDVGLMDDNYFLYYEETDLCLRINKAGWSCWYVPESRIVHLRGQSTGVTSYNSVKRRPEYWFESRQRYFLKNHGLLYTIIADALWILGYSLFLVRAKIQGKPYLDPPKMFIDFIRKSIFFSISDSQKTVERMRKEKA